MNIFEALEKGNGKATLAHFDDVAYWKDGYGFCWERNHYPTISFSHLKCNDWMPYVPPEERKIEGMLKFTDPWVAYYHTINEWRKMGYRDDYIDKFVIKPNVPRETCSNCGDTYPGKTIKLTPDWACNECGRLFKFEVMPSLKVKHKEVFENVRWYRAQWNIIYPAPIGINQEDSNKKLLNKPPMTMTLEWKE